MLGFDGFKFDGDFLVGFGVRSQVNLSKGPGVYFIIEDESVAYHVSIVFLISKL
jgi:hypothetical protein